jgi:DNA-binding transcriptional ArsR family regulator/protein-L-isoaspartate O-methyltransferase
MSGPLPPRSERWELYKLLAEPARLRLLALAGEDELAVSELAELMGESQPNVSRHATPLRQHGLLTVRRQGTWTLMRLSEGALEDPVVSDAVHTGRILCERDGTLHRVAQVVRAREQSTREFFARAKHPVGPPGYPSELSAYLAALAPLISERSLALDAGTGDGGSLELLAPLFERVIAVDRAEAQLAQCRERVKARGFTNVSLIQGELDGAEVLEAIKSTDGADLVLAARVLHHSPKPMDTVRKLAQLARPGGVVAVIDYEHHEDEALREQQADLWLGFDPEEMEQFARHAGLEPSRVFRLPTSFNGTGPDRHLHWQVMIAYRPVCSASVNARATTKSRK